jgi:hypothetical protein
MIEYPSVHTLNQIDRIEKEFSNCSHPYSIANELDWCNICGACRVWNQHIDRIDRNGTWLQPHWRVILCRALLKKE